MGCGSTAPYILKLSTRRRWVVSLTTEGEPPFPNELEAGWIPKPVGTLWSREKSLMLARNQLTILWLSSL
jgi:hypothetical protein